MLAPAKVGGLRERHQNERNMLQPQRFLKPTPRPAPILADDADTPSLAVAFDKLGLPDAARCAARFGCDRPYAWQWQALRQGVAHKNLVYSAPASGGKTLVAELCLLRRLEEAGKHAKALVVLPLKALGAAQRPKAAARAQPCHDKIIHRPLVSRAQWHRRLRTLRDSYSLQAFLARLTCPARASYLCLPG